MSVSVPTDLANNLYQLEFGGASIGLRDAKTGTVTIYRTPTQGSKPRRGWVEIEQRALRQRQPDRALDITSYQLVDAP